MSSQHDPDSKVKQKPRVELFWWIFAVAVAVLIGVWIYNLLGKEAAEWFRNGAIGVFVVLIFVVAWRLHRWRQRKALDLLSRWADQDDAKSTRPPRK